MARLITVALMSLIVVGTEPLSAKDYILKLEFSTDCETKVGNGKIEKKSDLRTIEILITPERRFHGKTTWEKDTLAVKGKLTETEDGKLAVEIDCRYSRPATPGCQPVSDDP